MSSRIGFEEEVKALMVNSRVDAAAYPVEAMKNERQEIRRRQEP